MENNKNRPPLNAEYLPMSREEMKKLGWTDIDVLLVTGDAYVDHPSYGIAVVGRVLLSLGYRTGIIAQPDWKNPDCLKRLGRPLIAAGVSGGNMDSMLSIYTAGRRYRKDDAYAPGGKIGMRPQMATVVYTQLVKASFPGLPVFLGGMEASLRRIAHYDYWQDKIRPSVITDSKADILVYGMGERALTEIMDRLSSGSPLEGIRGTVRFCGKKSSEEFLATSKDFIELPPYEEVQKNPDALLESTKIIEREINPWCGKRLIQRYGDRIMIQEPPQEPLNCSEFDKVADLPFSGMPHPSYKEKIPAFETVKDSIPAVRGCPGGCAFCCLASHQGRFLSSRSEESIVLEIQRLMKRKVFHGTVSDIGGAAGNILGHHPADPEKCKHCRRISCIQPSLCPNYRHDEKILIKLLRRLRSMPGLKHVFINSGIRLDLALRQPELTKEIIRHHVSGHLKVAPEHLHPEVVKLMRKDPPEAFYKFMEIFERESKAAGKEQYLIPLFISNFPGCTEKEMKVVDDFLNKKRWSPQQVQDFIPLPMTMAAAMYYCGKTPDGKSISVNRGLRERRPQISMLKKKR